MNRLADETIQACPHGCHGEVANTDCPQHGRPISKPLPAPGQRWWSPYGNCTFDVLEIRSSSGQTIVVAESPAYAKHGAQWINIDNFAAEYRYLGLTPTPNPTPASPALPAALPSQSGGSGAPPEGYVPCRGNCGRWNHADIDRCWACYYANCPEMRGHEYPKELEAKYPDWTPPASAPPDPIGLNWGGESLASGAAIAAQMEILQRWIFESAGISPPASAAPPVPAVPLKNCPHALRVGLCPLCEPERAAEFVAERRARVSSDWIAAVNSGLTERAKERARRPDPLAGLLRDDVDLFWARDA